MHADREIGFDLLVDQARPRRDFGATVKEVFGSFTDRIGVRRFAIQRREGIEPCERGVLFGLRAEIFGSLVGDRLEVVLREKDLDPGGFESCFQQPGRGEIQHGFLHRAVLAPLEEPLFHARPFAADVTGVENDALDGQRRTGIDG